MLTEREQASLIWLAVAVAALLIWAAQSPSWRSSLAGVLTAFFGGWKLVAAVLVFWVTVAAAAWTASQVDAWERGMLKETVVWAAVAGFAALASAAKVHAKRGSLTRLLTATLGWTLLIEFVFGLVSFPLWVELVIQPALLFVVILEMVAKQQDEAKQVASCLGWVLALAGFGFFIGTSLQIWAQRGAIDWTEQLKVLAMMVWLPIATLPFIVGLGWVMNFEQVSGQLRLYAPGGRVRWWMRAAVVTGLRGDLYLLGRFRAHWVRDVAQSSAFRPAFESVKRFRADIAQEERDARNR